MAVKFIDGRIHPVNKKPLVSIILPTRNREKLLHRAIKSILDQTYPDFELIVVDDASSDGTSDVVRSLEDSRIKYIRHSTTQGASAARNSGWREAAGDYIAFQDSDDKWLEEKLALQVSALDDSSDHVGVCVCSLRQNIRGKIIDVVHPAGEKSGEAVAKQLITGTSYGTVALLVKRKAFASVGGFEERLTRRQDFELCLRLAERWAFRFLPDILVETCLFEDSISTDPFKFLDATQVIFEKHSQLFLRHRDGYSMQLYRAGKYLAFAGFYKSAIPLLIRALKANPLNWRASALTACLLSGAIPIKRKLRL